MIVTSQHAVGTSVIQIASPDDNPQTIIVHDHTHTGADYVYLGGADVATTNGLHLPKTETITILLAAGDGLFAVSDGGTVDVHVLQTKR